MFYCHDIMIQFWYFLISLSQFRELIKHSHIMKQFIHLGRRLFTDMFSLDTDIISPWEYFFFKKGQRSSDYLCPWTFETQAFEQVVCIFLAGRIGRETSKTDNIARKVSRCTGSQSSWKLCVREYFYFYCKCSFYILFPSYLLCNKIVIFFFIAKCFYI